VTPAQRCARRAAALAAVFAEIQRTRMAGVPVLNPRLHVQAVGFEPLADPAAGEAALGVLLTPWFMNLVWLPLRRSDAPVRSDQHRLRGVVGAEIEFTLASEPALGSFESCSLFSPMFQFTSQAAAVATAQHVLHELRPAHRPARRAFLFGRGEALA